MKTITLIHTVKSMLLTFDKMVIEATGEAIRTFNLYDDFLASPDPQRSAAAREQERLDRLYLLLKTAEPVSDLAVVACSTLSVEVQLVRRFFRMPVLAIDDVMLREAVRLGVPLTLFATSPNPIEPVQVRLKDIAIAAGLLPPQVSIALCTEALPHLLANDLPGLRAQVLSYLENLYPKPAAVVLAQASTAFMREEIEQMCGCPVLSSIPYCLAEILQILASPKGPAKPRMSYCTAF